MKRYMSLRKSRESGFSMMETLAVMLVLGIIAAIAVPSFISQQKSSRDNEVRSDVQITAQTIRDLTLKFPTARSIKYVTQANKTSASIYVDINGNNIKDANEPSEIVGKSKNNQVAVYVSGPGQYDVYGWNTKGRHYKSQSSAALWSKALGGFKEGTHASPIAGS